MHSIVHAGTVAVLLTLGQSNGQEEATSYTPIFDVSMAPMLILPDTTPRLGELAADL
jgi:hypothetical protein